MGEILGRIDGEVLLMYLVLCIEQALRSPCWAGRINNCKNRLDADSLEDSVLQG